MTMWSNKSRACVKSADTNVGNDQFFDMGNFDESSRWMGWSKNEFSHSLSLQATRDDALSSASRFTPRVGGGSAFFVRHLEDERIRRGFASKIFMKLVERGLVDAVEAVVSMRTRYRRRVLSRIVLGHAARHHTPATVWSIIPPLVPRGGSSVGAGWQIQADQRVWKLTRCLTNREAV